MGSRYFFRTLYDLLIVDFGCFRCRLVFLQSVSSFLLNVAHANSLAVGVLALYTGLILWRLFVRLDSLKYPLKTYGDMAERIFGKIARHVCTVLQSLQLLVNVRDRLNLFLYQAR